MNYVTHKDINGLSTRLGTFENEISHFTGSMEARMNAVEKAQIEYRKDVDLLKRGQNKIVGAIIAINGIAIFLVAFGSAYFKLTR